MKAIDDLRIQSHYTYEVRKGQDGLAPVVCRCTTTIKGIIKYNSLVLNIDKTFKDTGVEFGVTNTPEDIEEAKEIARKMADYNTLIDIKHYLIVLHNERSHHELYAIKSCLLDIAGEKEKQAIDKLVYINKARNKRQEKMEQMETKSTL